MLGVNISGGEYKESGLAYGRDYIFPSNAEIDYYAGKGMDVIRVPFQWERLQKIENGALNGEEVARLKAVVAYANTKGLTVILDAHDYGTRTIGGTSYKLGVDAKAPASLLADFWGRMATEFKGSDVFYGIMNEPHYQTAAQWAPVANAAIQAIREAGASEKILVPGTNWTGAHNWVSGQNDTEIGAKVVDPGNNFAFEVHQYLDSDSSGTHASVVSETIGVERLTAITAWAKATGNELFLGEFGAANNPTALSALDKMVDYMDRNADVWIGATYWAGGAWWGNYMYSIEPTDLKTKGVNATDKAQMDILEKYDLVNGNGTPTPVPTPTPTPTPTPVPTGSTVKLERVGGSLVNEGQTIGLKFTVEKAVVGQSFTIGQDGGMNAADFSKTMAESFAGKEGVAFTANSATSGKVTFLKEGNFSFTIDRPVALDNVAETTDKATWAAGNQEQTDIRIDGLTGGLTASGAVQSAWVTDVNGTLAPTPGVITTTGLKIVGTAASDTIQANDLGNKIYAKNGNDIVKGGAGADFIDGGAGLDNLFGGGGHDTFYFNSSNDAKGDTILDFVQGSDRIDLSKIDAVSGGATSDVFSFIGAGAFTKAGQLHFTQDKAKGVTYVEGNLDANPGAEFRIEVKGLHTFASGDFIL